jgi:tryptophanyl-tRNA synthetase
MFNLKSTNKSSGKKILLSGVKPTGEAHIGNYFGMMKQALELQNSGKYEPYLFIADYHALNLIQNAEEMRKFTEELVLDFLAIGLDPKKSVIFKQSDVPAHTELAWIFDTIVTMPYLMRAHAYKDAEAKNKELNVGTFNYPVLMAADILLYNTDVVPVGQDQKQHVEYARDISEKFNFIFKTSTFKLPEPLILDNVATVPGTDGRKMSKSHNNTIPLFSTREQITKAVMSIVTDAGLGAIGPDGKPSDGIPKNVYAIHKLFKSEVELKPLYEANKGKYKILKDALINDMDAFIKPIRDRRAELAKDTKLVAKVLADGAKKANIVAAQKLEEAKRAVGVL